LPPPEQSRLQQDPNYERIEEGDRVVYRQKPQEYVSYSERGQQTSRDRYIPSEHRYSSSGQYIGGYTQGIQVVQQTSRERSQSPYKTYEASVEDGNIRERFYATEGKQGQRVYRESVKLDREKFGPLYGDVVIVKEGPPTALQRENQEREAAKSAANREQYEKFRQEGRYGPQTRVEGFEREKAEHRARQEARQVAVAGRDYTTQEQFAESLFARQGRYGPSPQVAIAPTGEFAVVSRGGQINVSMLSGIEARKQQSLNRRERLEGQDGTTRIVGNGLGTDIPILPIQSSQIEKLTRETEKIRRIEEARRNLGIEKGLQNIQDFSKFITGGGASERGFFGRALQSGVSVAIGFPFYAADIASRIPEITLKTGALGSGFIIPETRKTTLQESKRARKEAMKTIRESVPEILGAASLAPLVGLRGSRPPLGSPERPIRVTSRLVGETIEPSVRKQRPSLPEPVPASARPPRTVVGSAEPTILSKITTTTDLLRLEPKAAARRVPEQYRVLIRDEAVTGQRPLTSVPSTVRKSVRKEYLSRAKTDILMGRDTIPAGKPVGPFGEIVPSKVETRTSLGLRAREQSRELTRVEAITGIRPLTSVPARVRKEIRAGILGRIERPEPAGPFARQLPLYEPPSVMKTRAKEGVVSDLLTGRRSPLEASAQERKAFRKQVRAGVRRTDGYFDLPLEPSQSETFYSVKQRSKENVASESLGRVLRGEISILAARADVRRLAKKDIIRGATRGVELIKRQGESEFVATFGPKQPGRRGLLADIDQLGKRKPIVERKLIQPFLYLKRENPFSPKARIREIEAAARRESGSGQRLVQILEKPRQEAKLFQLQKAKQSALSKGATLNELVGSKARARAGSRLFETIYKVRQRARSNLGIFPILRSSAAQKSEILGKTGLSQSQRQSQKQEAAQQIFQEQELKAAQRIESGQKIKSILKSGQLSGQAVGQSVSQSLFQSIGQSVMQSRMKLNRRLMRNIGKQTLFKKIPGITPEKVQAYNVYVKAAQAKLAKGRYRSRGYTRANKEPLTRAAAINRLASILDTYTNRSGYVRATNARVARSNEAIGSLIRKFRANKRGGLTERTSFAIDSFEEKQGIPYEAARRRKGASKRGAFSFLGGKMSL